MDLKLLKNLCYSAASATSIAQLHEKEMKVEFIKGYFFSHLTTMRITEGGVSCLDVDNKFIYMGINRTQIFCLCYDPQEPKRSSVCGITAFGIDKTNNGAKLEIALENLSYEDIHSIFVALSMDIK